MNAVLLKVKIDEARQRVCTAERELEEQMKGLSAASGGEKTIVAQLLDSAFSALRDAKKDLVELTKLLDDDAAATVPAERSCPACRKIIRAEARLCGYCWTKLT
jgi:hypothetical protein